MDPKLTPLFEAVTRRYIGTGKYAWHFTRRKLRHDPVFFALLRQGLLPDSGSLLDLGCGRGILLSLLTAAKEQYLVGAWPHDWAAPPLNLVLRGIDLDPGCVQVARRALGRSAQLDQGDLRDVDPPSSSVIVMLDVLFYLERHEQDLLLDRAAMALEPGGLLLVRETDAGAGFAFHVTRWAERLAGALRGEFAHPLRYRSAAHWIAAIRERGFRVDVQPMSDGTPFANFLLAARKSPASPFRPRLAAARAAPG